jgi:GGDEF domain-containing protein
MEGAEQVSETVRTLILAARGQSEFRVQTASLGGASLIPQPGLTSADLIRSADLALYDAKTPGPQQNRSSHSHSISEKEPALAVTS